MNKIHIPIRSVHLETVFERSEATGPGEDAATHAQSAPTERTVYALLDPAGDVTPLRVKVSDFRQKLADRFSAELPDQEVARRLSQPSDLELVAVIHLERQAIGLWELLVRLREQPAKGARTEAKLSEARRSPRRAPVHPTDIKLELGQSSIEGTVYNVSEHGLGIALFTTQLERLVSFKIDEEVEVVDPGQEERLRGRIRSQYPADGGCVLGIELRDRFQVKPEA